MGDITAVIRAWCGPPSLTCPARRLRAAGAAAWFRLDHHGDGQAAYDGNRDLLPSVQTRRSAPAGLPLQCPCQSQMRPEPAANEMPRQPAGPVGRYATPRYQI